MNKVVLIGRLTKDVELRFTPGSGNAVANFTLAVDKYNSSTGQKEADFIPCVVWGKQAEALSNYCSKGSQIAIGGRIQTRSYDDQQGNKRYVTEVLVGEQQFLSKNKNTQPNNNNVNNQNNDMFDGGSFEDDITPVDDGDMPF